MKHNDQPIATFDRVTKKFGRLRAVDEVSFSVGPGEVLGVVGDDESGKTTLISLLMGFSRISRGTIVVDEQKLTPHRAHRAHRATGYAAYDTALPRSMTGERYLSLVASRRQASKGQYERLVRAFRPELYGRLDTLSAINQQKIALTAAFLGSPKLLVLDEPTRGLDVLSREVLLEAVRTASRQGAAIVLSSQYPGDIAQVCSRLLLLKDGKVAHDLSREDIIRHTGKNVTVYSEKAIALPAEATKLRTGSDRKVKFSYTGTTQALLEWINGLEGKDVEDIEIESRSLDDEYRHLYADPEDDNE